MLLLMNNTSGNFSLASYYCSHGPLRHGDPTRMQAGIQNTDDNRRVHKLEKQKALKKKKKEEKITYSWPSVGTICFDIQILYEK